jgi:S-(hydroxymethyl)glutathione dehydrogenase / alcohol dehydrogenase
MKAAILRDLSCPMSIEDIQISKPKCKEVLVRIAATGVCHSDLHVLTGDLPQSLPVILGHESAGVVEQVGPDVRGVHPGDHVVVCLTFHCGHCEQCLSGNSHRCFTPEAVRSPNEPARLFRGEESFAQFSQIGGFAEQILVHESGCVPIRKDMPLDRACLISCGVTTGFGAAVRSANVRVGEIVAVIGCGGVGLAAINGALVAGASRIIAVDRLPVKLEMARTFGATDTLDATEGGVVERVLAMTAGRGVDHAIEAIGRKESIEDAFSMLAKGGMATIAGIAPVGTKLELPAMALLRERGLRGSLMGGVRTSIDIPRYIELYMQGRLKLDELISCRRPLEQLNQAFDDMRQGHLARSVMVFDH